MTVTKETAREMLLEIFDVIDRYHERHQFLRHEALSIPFWILEEMFIAEIKRIPTDRDYLITGCCQAFDDSIEKIHKYFNMKPVEK